METNTMQPQNGIQNAIISTSDLLKHWQGHRRLTRRVIDAFPEEDLFKFSVGGMRPFSELALEMIHMAAPGVRGVLTGKWVFFWRYGKRKMGTAPQTKAALLQLWDKTTEQIDELWPQIPAERFREVDVAFRPVRRCELRNRLLLYR